MIKGVVYPFGVDSNVRGNQLTNCDLYSKKLFEGELPAFTSWCLIKAISYLPINEIA
jgi:hypothetical protein